MNELMPGLLYKARAEDSAGVPTLIPEAMRVPPLARREFGLPEVMTIIRHRLKLIVGILLVSVVVGGVAAIAEKPKYVSSALLMISPKKDRVVADQQALSQTTPDSTFVDSEVEILRSPALVKKLVTSLSLDKDPEWNPQLQPPGLIDGAKSALGGLVKSLAGKAQPAASADAGLLSTMTLVTKAIKVRRRGLSYIMEVAVESESADKAASMANAFAGLYFAAQREAQIETSAKADVWLQQRVDQLKTEVEQKEAVVQDYRARKNLLNAQGVSLSEQQISDVQNSVVATRADFAEKQARYRQVTDMIAAGGSPDSIAAALQSEVIRELRVKEATISARQTDLENRYGASHPEVISIRKERADIEGLINAETARLAANLKNELTVVEARLQTLESSLNSARTTLVGQNTDTSRLVQLEGDSKAAREVYQTFLQRLHEVSNQGDISAVDARVVSAALPAQLPSSPNFLLTIAMALAGGVGAAFIAVFVLEQFRDTLHAPEEVDAKVGIAAIAAIPRLSRKDLARFGAQHAGEYLSKRPMSPFAESLRGLRTAVLYSILARPRKVVAVTSAVAGEGKTTTAMCLAQIAAMAGQRVVLVDCDLRRHSLNRFLGLSPKVGLLQVLSGEADWRSVVETHERTGVHVIPVCGGSFTARDVFGTEAMERLVSDLSEAYDFVVLDCAPVLALAETSVAVAHADGVVMVCQWNKTPAKAVRAAIEQLEVTHARVIGVVLNGLDPHASGRSKTYRTLYMSRAANAYFQR